MFIGITGQIGAGKSTAAKMFASSGAAVIDADKIGHKVIEQSPELLEKLVQEFGGRILARSGKLNRKKLASLAFANQSGKERLDKLVHTYLLRELRRQMREEATKNELVVVDAALLLDWQLDREMDFVLVIHASEKARFQRLRERGISLADARARQKRQLPFSEYRARADRLILNNRSLEILKGRLAAFEKFIRNRLTKS